MALGRVPVIIADDWVPFSIEESNYYVRISEADIGKIDKILAMKLESYDALRKCVEFAYGTYFAPEKRYSAALNRLVSLSTTSRAHLSRRSLQKRLHTARKLNGLLYRQQIVRKFRDRLMKIANKAIQRRTGDTQL